MLLNVSKTEWIFGTIYKDEVASVTTTRKDVDVVVSSEEFWTTLRGGRDISSPTVLRFSIIGILRTFTISASEA